MIGDLRHEIILQTASRASDGAGGSITTWSDFKTIWAEIKPRSALKRSFAGKLEADTTHVVTMRFLDGVSTGMQITFGKRTFQIHSILNEEERNIWLYLQCVEGTGS